MSIFWILPEAWDVCPAIPCTVGASIPANSTVPNFDCVARGHLFTCLVYESYTNIRIYIQHVYTSRHVDGLP